ncbi:MAG: nitroreductase [Bacteroidota bacterium]|nr:nitroreductase [Bacteroidota bacterium]
MIREILPAANWAPTHGLTEPWRFIIFSGKEGVQKFGQLHADLYKQETPEEQFLQKKYDKILHKPDHASHLIVIAMKRGKQENIPEQEELAATACAVQNILLTASTSGLATYWGTGGMCYHPSLKKYFGLGAEDKIMGFLYMGYSDKEHPKGFRHTGIEEKITWM